MTCGADLYSLAVASTVMVLLALETLNFIIQRFGTRNINITFSSRSLEDVREAIAKMRNDGMTIDSYNMHEHGDSESPLYTVSVEVNVKRNKYESRVMGIMKELDGVRIESIE